MILEGIIIAPRWSMASNTIVVVIVRPFGLEFLSQAKAILHLMLGIFVEGARSLKDLVLLIIVVLGSRFFDGGDDVVWPATAILPDLGPSG